MSEIKAIGSKLTLFGVIKEIFNWYPAEYPSQETKLLFKLDVSILVFACLCYQTNISNAYVSGLKEDFSLNGNQLNYFNVCYYTAYVVFQVPGLLLLSRPKLARWLLPTLEILWGICTFAQSRVTNVQQLYAIRFLVGMLEAPVFAGTHFILGSWYSGPELFKRAGMWFICNPLGSMVSGYLQAAAYRNLSGVGGMPGWRWLFIIDGIFTIPVAIIGYFVFPGIPDSPKPFYLSDDDIALAKERSRRSRIQRPGKLDLNVFKRTAKRWHIWIFVFCYICMIISSYPFSYMNLWLKSQGTYTVTQINDLPTVTYAIQIVASWLGTTLAAVYPSWLIYGIASFCCLFSTLCMIIWHIPSGLKFVAWYLFGLSGCLSPILYSTVNTIVKNDSEERALILGTMMTVGYSFNIWVPLLLFPTAGPYGAPRWKKGWPVTFAFLSLLLIGFLTSLVLHRRESRKMPSEVSSDAGSNGEEDSGDIIVSGQYDKRVDS
ncbi:pantothenate transporter, putative [Talaromyces stipitatus ATCC 10500]|uniref:Pantothenate transporter, putative n=1 Tax=Talaromyces stipitatus (strain ATCC 10500 / CBS 375.48 / QM 6759 / NRRL 1006) TaxID=441959 RepID=B8M4P2_TALSN|nr:pantothenate transporter, putative [Talaromyces stipitatus ATCC 10500]EED19237.1 pantothenate transporter, putative [Talaromyces stipitatus ATCC 10500]